MRFWTLAANPGAFRVEDNVREQDEDLWRTNRSKIARGDRVAIYKYKGRDRYRGIVSLGDVLTDHEMMSIPPGTDRYEVIRGYGRELAARTEWVRVRYVRSPRMPLWADLGSGSVVDELAVARAQGGTVHHVTPEQWERLLEEAGLAGWPPAESPAADAIEDEVAELVRQRRKVIRSCCRHVFNSPAFLLELPCGNLHRTTLSYAGTTAGRHDVSR